MRRRKADGTLQKVLTNAGSSLVPSTRIPELNLQRRFSTTHWSLVVQSRGRSSVAAEFTLAELCSIDWLAVFSRTMNRLRGEHDVPDQFANEILHLFHALGS